MDVHENGDIDEDLWPEWGEREREEKPKKKGKC